MLSMRPLEVLLSIAWLLVQCQGQAFHTVTIGDTGSFYDPPTVSALQGDIVTFIFAGRSHSVTQSSFDAPCTRLQGGFDSDSWGVQSLGDPVPQWNLTITNDTQTIWFYCKNTLPLPHCTSGMVGAINPPTGTDQNYTAFRNAAKAIQGTPVATPGAVLSGIGASATAVPTPIAIANVSSTSSIPSSTSSSSSTTSTTSSTLVQSATTTPSSTTAAKVGGAVGGSLGGIILIGAITLAVLACRRKSRRRTKSNRDPFHNDTSTIDNRSVSWVPYQVQNDFSPVSEPNRQTVSSIHSPAPSVTQNLNNLTPTTEDTRQSLASQVSTGNVRELAAEIAALIKGGGSTTLTSIDENQADVSSRAPRPLPSVSQAVGGQRNRSQETLPVYTGRD